MKTDNASAGLAPASGSLRFTKAQRALLEVISDGDWHTFGGRREAMIYRLADMGVVEYRHVFCMPGMPIRMQARLKANVPVTNFGAGKPESKTP